MVLRMQGWISRERARETGQLASADAALDSLRSTPRAPRPGDVALATTGLRWARELLAAKPRLSEFERDAVLVASGGRLPRERRWLRQHPAVREDRHGGAAEARVAVDP